MHVVLEKPFFIQVRLVRIFGNAEADVEDSANLAALGTFCRRMGRVARKGEIGLVIGDEYVAIRDFSEE
jgi:hypothetical protein